MVIGQRIEERLMVVQMSQAALGRRVGLNQSTINGLIRGDQRSSTKLHEIARALQTTSAYLSGETDDPRSDQPDFDFTYDEQEWIGLLRQLIPKDRDAVIQLTQSLAKNAPRHTVHSKRSGFKAQEKLHPIGGSN